MDEEARRRRLNFPEDEAGNPWLSMLLDAYAVVDAGVTEALARHVEREPRDRVACSRGCAPCCVDNDVPVLLLEAVGLEWFVLHKATRENKAAVLKAIHEFPRRRNTGAGCPFLRERSCLVYVMRPIACRNFVVFNTPCAYGEDATETRPQEVLKPKGARLRQAFRYMLPYYGFTEEGAVDGSVSESCLLKVIGSMHLVDWSGLAGSLAVLLGRE